MAKLSWSALLALAAVLVSAADVAGHHRPNALYTGTHSAGGQVEINTSIDNSVINRYRFTDVPCQGMPGSSLSSGISYSIGGELITAHAATVDNADYLFAASFGESGAASGSWQHRSAGPDSCITETVTWTATTTAPLPGACVDGDDNDGDGKIDLVGGDPGCAGLFDTEETDPPPPVPPDTTAPSAALSGKKTQKASMSVSVTVGCGAEACTASAGGSVNVPVTRAAKRLKLRSATAQIAAGSKATLKLGLSAKTLKAVKKALSRRAKVSAKIAVKTVDAAGNSSSRTRAVKLTR
jgi:hypothetical protein